jgi:hypothetical protein
LLLPDVFLSRSHQRIRSLRCGNCSKARIIVTEGAIIPGDRSQIQEYAFFPWYFLFSGVVDAEPDRLMQTFGGEKRIGKVLKRACCLFLFSLPWYGIRSFRYLLAI